MRHIFTAYTNLTSFDFPISGQQVQYRLAHDSLAAAGFSNNAENLALPNGKVDSADCFYLSLGGIKADRIVAQLQNFLVHGCTSLRPKLNNPAAG